MAVTRPSAPSSPIQTAAQHVHAGHISEAEEIYRQILNEHPEHHDALFNLAVVLGQQGKLDEAATYYRKVIAQKPDMIEAHNNLGDTYFRQRNLTDALPCFQKALALRPGSVEVHNNIGNILKFQNRFTEALQSYKKALSLKPGNPVLINNLGEAYRCLNRLDEAEEHFRKALAIKPNFPQAQWNQCLIYLLRGEYKHGFPLYEKRFAPELENHFFSSGIWTMLAKFSGKPRWTGEDLQGKTLAVWAEQGFGDSIMMMRYLPLLREKGAASIIIYCRQELVKIMLTQTPLIVSYQHELPLDAIDLHCSLLSLPYILGSTLENLPNKVPYLNVPIAASAKWEAQLRKFPGLKIGLVWHGSKNIFSDTLRSIPLDMLSPLINLPNIQFVSLQKGDASTNQHIPEKWRVIDWMEGCEDLMDTAALIDKLDLVISVDTAVAHLAGALGKPVWLLNRFESEWRWMMERNDSPWYPSMRIFRQPSSRDWSSVITTVREELEKLAKKADQQQPLDEPGWQHALTKSRQALGIGGKKGLFSRLFG